MYTDLLALTQRICKRRLGLAVFGCIAGVPSAENIYDWQRVDKDVATILASRKFFVVQPAEDCVVHRVVQIRLLEIPYVELTARLYMTQFA